MNYYAARQIGSGEKKGKWHYTCQNGDKIWAVGYCAEDCPGHETPEQAQEHYKLYQLEKALRLHPREMPTGGDLVGATISACKECSAPTVGFAEVGFGIPTEIPLCPIHCTREVVEKHFNVGESWSSY